MQAIRSGHFHFRMSRSNCIKLAQLFYEEKRIKNVDELEDLLGGRVKGIIDGKLQWENWGRMIRIREDPEEEED